MSSIETLIDLSADMNLEPAEENQPLRAQACREKSIFTQKATLPNGKQIVLLKSLLSSACENDCYYCPFRAGRDYQRQALKPDEFAQIFMAVHRAGITEGLFISSGVVKGGVNSQNLLLDLAEILRYHYEFRGYLHLKMMPGVEKGQVERAMQLADRVSVNLEAPNDLRLRNLSSRKHFIHDLIQPLRWVKEIRKTMPAFQGWNGRLPSATTQFVLGGAGESDRELLETTQVLFGDLDLKRAYYSPFRPIQGTPFENHPPTLISRAHRLYQASFLMRDYGFLWDEIILDGEGNLPLHTDPKKIWAEEYLRPTPVEINHASRRELLRVPGIGPRSVETILLARRQKKITDLSALGRLGVQSQRAAPFVLLDGKQPTHQLSFAVGF